MKLKILKTILILQIFTSFCSGQSKNIDFEFCNCNDSGNVVILKYKLNKINVLVCVEHIDTSGNMREYGGINVLNCDKNINTKISDLDNLNWFQVEAFSDTIFFNFPIKTFDIKTQILYQILLFNKNDSIQMSYRFYKNFKFATDNEKQILRKKYLSFKINDFENNWETKINSLGWELLFCSISGDPDARKRLLNCNKYYKDIQV
jgi:hypothetical protein